MKKDIIIKMLFIIGVFSCFYQNAGRAQAQITWAYTYGGSGYEQAAAIQQTSDGGYIIAGHTQSLGASNYDLYILKLDLFGNAIWQRAYGGSGDDRAQAIQQTSDGGYIVAGYTNSFGLGNYDVWILKLDSAGAIQWQKTLGGSGVDKAVTIE